MLRGTPVPVTRVLVDRSHYAARRRAADVEAGPVIGTGATWRHGRIGVRAGEEIGGVATSGESHHRGRERARKFFIFKSHYPNTVSGRLGWTYLDFLSIAGTGKPPNGENLRMSGAADGPERKQRFRIIQKRLAHYLTMHLHNMSLPQSTP